MRTSFRQEAGPISRQQGNSNTQTGQLDPRTLLRKRYVIVRAIGQGGMAAVYEARDTRRGTSCAIKEMSLSTVPTQEQPQAIQNFLAEARILSRLNHPNLPAFTDFFTEGSRRFLVMEFIDGKTLEDLLEANKGSFTERRVLGWARQLCDVLEYLHGQQPPIIFRDLKPGNIMLTRGGRIKLIDFGIARIFRSSGGKDTQLLGTPGFAPPEQYGSAQTDERSDIYSLGMTLFQLMSDTVNDGGFGLKDVHLTYPHISSPVARVLEKATALKPDDRYQSVTIFRRALLGIGTFRFENGGEATTPDELADLCSHYPDEAADYLFAGEIESWLQEINKDEMARGARRIHATIGDPDVAVERLISLLNGTEVRTRVSQSGQTGTYPRVSGSGSSRAEQVQEPEMVIEPKTIDFGPAYPGLSAPILLTISGVRGALVSGILRPVESWIVLDATTFDGTRTPINVRVDSTRLRGSTHYTGTIMVVPDESEREIAVTIEVDVLGYTTATIARKQAGNTQSGTQLDDDDDVVVPGSGRMRMAPQATVMVDQPLNTSRNTEYQSKYGPPGSGGWDPLQNVSTSQSSRMKGILTFTSALMTAGFFYLIIAHLPAFQHGAPVPPNPWFTLVLLLMGPATVLGTMIVNWLSTWSTHDMLNRVCTGLVAVLAVLGIGESAWQNIFGNGGGTLQFIIMLLVTALAATFGTLPKVSERIIKIASWGMRRARWLMRVLAMVLGGSLGFAITNGLSSGWFAPLGILLGLGVGALLILRVDHLLKQKPHP